MKQILRITHFTSSAGGAEKYVLTLSRNLNKLGYNNIIVCPQSDFSEKVTEAGIEQFNLNVRESFSSIYQLVKFIRTHKIDIVHTHNYYGHKRGLIAAALSRPPAVFTTVLNFLNINENGNPKHNFPLWVHNQLIKHIPDRVITVSQANRKNIIQETRLPSERVEVVLDGVDLEEGKPVNQNLRASIKQELKLNSKHPVIAVIARLDLLKGHSYLFEALPFCLARFPRLKLLVVGSGSAEQEYREQVKRLNLDRSVIFTGAYHHEKVLALLSLLDLMVLPSLSEASGLIIMEAFLMGAPVVTTNAGGIPEYVEDHQTGILCEPRDSPGLAQAICSILSNHDLRKKLAKAGQKAVWERFSAFNHAKSMAELYEQFLSSDNK